MCGAIRSQNGSVTLVSVTLVPLLGEGAERKMDEPAASYLMALDSQLVGEFCIGQWHCFANIQPGSNGGIFREVVEQEHEETRPPVAAHPGSCHPSTFSSSCFELSKPYAG